MAGIDFAAFTESADAPRTMSVVHPSTGETLTFTDAEGHEAPVTITLHSLDSAAAQAAKRDSQRRRMRGGLAKLTPEKLEAEGIALLAAVTVSWAGITWKGEALDCTPANAVMLYEQARWLRAQVDEFVSERANYMGN